MSSRHLVVLLVVACGTTCAPQAASCSSSWYGCYDRAVEALSNGELEEARELLLDLLGDKPKPMHRRPTRRGRIKEYYPYYYLGRVLEELNDKPGAMAAYKQSIHADADHRGRNIRASMWKPKPGLVKDAIRSEGEAIRARAWDNLRSEYRRKSVLHGNYLHLTEETVRETFNSALKGITRTFIEKAERTVPSLSKESEVYEFQRNQVARLKHKIENGKTIAMQVIEEASERAIARRRCQEILAKTFTCLIAITRDSESKTKASHEELAAKVKALSEEEGLRILGQHQALLRLIDVQRAVITGKNPLGMDGDPKDLVAQTLRKIPETFAELPNVAARDVLRDVMHPSLRVPN